MTSINATAAYIRTKGAPSDLSESAVQGQALAVKETRDVWRLLATAQTVESLRRRIAGDSGRAPDAAVVESILKELLDRDLIELSPDS